LHEKGKAHAVKNEGLTKQLLAQGYTVLLGDLPGIGELGPGYLKGDAFISKISYNQWFAGILTGKSIVGLRAGDIIRMAHFLESSLDGLRSVSAISVGVIGSEVLHSAVFDDVFDRICLVRPFLSFADIALSQDYPPAFIPSTVAGALDAYDLADLMAFLSPCKLLVINPLSGDGTVMEKSRAEEYLAFPESVYARKGRSENFQFACGKEENKLVGDIIDWLNR
jgi:hypothetical protein